MRSWRWAALAAPLCLAAAAQGQTVTRWQADGPGGTAYERIWAALGEGSIESPDLGPRLRCNPDQPHVQLVDDALLGRLVFRFHLEQARACDPTGTTPGRRERVEIKAWERSADALKARNGDRLRYRWRFFVEPTLRIGPRFSHFFQLKRAGVGRSPAEQHPLLTFTGAQGHFELRVGLSDERWARLPWSEVAGRWLQADVLVRYGQQGELSVTLQALDGGQHLVRVQRQLPLEVAQGFVRPKWGIYRDNAAQDLGDAAMRATDFEVSKD